MCGARVAKATPGARIEPGSELDLSWAKVVVGDRIGEGGMGVVYRGWMYYNPVGPQASTPEHPVAVKVLHPLLKSRERARRLFMGEASALGRLSHPNIVHFFSLWQEAGHLALHPKAAFKNLVSHKSEESDWMLVQPKQPDKSYLVMKLEGTHLKSGGKGARMPFAQQPLDTETVALFRAWIKAGALNN